MKISTLLTIISILFLSCSEDNATIEPAPTAYRITQTITYDSISVDVVIDKPALNEVDVLLVFHGTVLYDSNIMAAANNTLDKFKDILDRDDMMIVSVAYPQENLLFGDNIVQGEAALLWLKNAASQELGITVNKNGIPNDPRSFVETSGIRIGTAAETTRGRDEIWFANLAHHIADILT